MTETTINDNFNRNPIRRKMEIAANTNAELYKYVCNRLKK